MESLKRVECPRGGAVFYNSGMSVSSRHAVGASRTALIFLLLACLVCLLSAGLAGELMRICGRSLLRDRIFFPPAFAVSTPILFAGSLTLHLALRAIQQEQQAGLRKWLFISLGTAVAFVGTQIYGLWSMFPAVRSPEEAETGVIAFVFVLAALHAAHFFVATLFVCFVTASALNHRYDHEYFWGVKVCAWFWHALGAIWMAILAVFTIVIR